MLDHVIMANHPSRNLPHASPPDRHLVLFNTSSTTGAHSTNPNNDYSVLLDTGSTCSMFKNPHLLTNIRTSKDVLRAVTNGGHQDSNMKGSFDGFFEVWFNPSSILNILSLSQVTERYRVIMDTFDEDAIKVKVNKKRTLTFKCVGRGLYICDFSFMRSQERSPGSAEELTTAYNYRDQYNFALLVSSLKKNFTRREVKQADEAVKLHKHLGMPSYNRLMKMINGNEIRNCPITVEDVQRAVHIYGADVAMLKGRMVRQPPQHVPPMIPTPLPQNFINHHGKVIMSFDFFCPRERFHSLNCQQVSI